MLVLPSWSPHFQPAVRMKARAAQLGGHITRRTPADEDELLRAEAKDNDTLHTVTLSRDGKHAQADCTCDEVARGQFCLHIWAALLDLNADESDDGEGVGGASINDLSKLRLRPPKARKRDDALRPVRTAEPRWIGRLSLLRSSSHEDPDPTEGADPVSIFPTQRQVCYVVLPDLSQRHGGLVIDLQQRTAIASGWSKPKPLKIGLDTIDTLADPTDRELVSMMLGATWVTRHESNQAHRLDRGHNTYRIAPGAQRSILRRMISTGRAFLELEEDTHIHKSRQRPLRWSDGPDPWKLWLIGRPGAGELLIDLQLRRAGKRIAVTEPDVVLGGRDGLVILGRAVDAGPTRTRSRYAVATAAPFDDRDAFRWVGQFRDHRYADDGPDEGEYLDDLAEADADPDARGATDDNATPHDGAASVGVSALRVPEADIERFLERLYLLPQLPELDLPEGLGRAERMLDPVPHLDVYSPGSAQAAELLTGPGRNSLVARVSFDYAGQRISPARRGRFVPAAARPAEGDGGEAAGPNPTGAENAAANATPDPAESVTNDRDLSIEALDGEQQLVRRNLRAEREAIAATAGLGLRHTASPTGDVLLVSPKQMPRAVSSLLAAGWIVSADQKTIRAAGPPALSITTGIDWFELRGEATYERADGSTETLTLPQILAAARSGKNMIVLGDGTQALLPEQWLDEHGLLVALGKVEGDHLRFKSSQAAVLDQLLTGHDQAAFDDRFAEARAQLKDFEGIAPADASEGFGGTLRTYQREGLGWLDFLRTFGMGGILADDMGLGKTVQVLAMMHGRVKGDPAHCDMPASGAKTQKPAAPTKPSLIVVPRSVIFNWLDEAQKFCPELKVMAYSGPDRADLIPQFGDQHLIVTSFGLMRRDIDTLKAVEFDYAVLDEAQAIKNPASQSAKAARLLQADHRLALTGTPVENHLGDLWSIFEFLNPGMLGASARFSDLVKAASSNATAQRLADGDDADADANAALDEAAERGPMDFNLPDGVGVNDAAAGQTGTPADTIAQVARALRPFILRRTKSEVLKDLPAKTEQTILCEMEPAQRKVYDQLRTYYRGTLMQQLDAVSENGSARSERDAADDEAAADRAGASGVAGRGNAFMVLEALLRLRQAACHPALIDKQGIDTGGPDVPSAKLDTLSDMLAEVIDGGQKALVFSQFTSMLGLVRKRLDELGIRYAYLDGQTRNRKEVVEQFQEDPDLQVFLISLKAGGVGLNLTAAEYVFILDPWWNPAVEAQAIDRTHRIGQTKPVFAYRMICEDTVEQRIIELQARKRKLADAIVGGEQNLLQSLTRDDLEQLLS